MIYQPRNEYELTQATRNAAVGLYKAKIYFSNQYFSLRDFILRSRRPRAKTEIEDPSKEELDYSLGPISGSTIVGSTVASEFFPRMRPTR
jgi:hypothetical protein